jgi:hypothetical protein
MRCCRGKQSDVESPVSHEQLPELLREPLRHLWTCLMAFMNLQSSSLTTDIMYRRSVHSGWPDGKTLDAWAQPLDSVK